MMPVIARMWVLSDHRSTRASRLIVVEIRPVGHSDAQASGTSWRKN